jgi:fibronectin type 3 domain-containing protein
MEIMSDARRALLGVFASSLEPLETRRLMAAQPPFANATDNDTAYDANGTLHVAWYDTATGSLEYASRSASGVWSDQVTIDSITNLAAGQPGVGNYVQMAIDSQNRPAVAYIDSYNADVKYASKDSSGSWVVKPVVETLGSLYPSLAFTTGDTPFISYYVTTAKDLKTARWNGSTWVKSTVDSTGDVGRSSSIQRIPGAADRFAIAYEDNSTGDFKFAELSTAGLWNVTTVDSDPLAGGGFTSLAYDTNNNPAFSYYDSWTSTLKYASRSSAGTWTPTAISGRISYYTNLWFNPTDGKGHLVYYDKSGNLVNHLTKTSTGWTSPNANLLFGGGNRVSAAFKTDGTVAYTWGPPLTSPTTPMGVGIQSGAIATMPTIGTATAVSSSRIDVTWSYPTNLSQSGFKVGISIDGGQTFPNEVVVNSASARSSQITGLDGNTTYTFNVRATSANGDSSFSWWATATTPVSPPAAPGGLVVSTGGTQQINLAWDDVAGETSYKVDRSANGTSGWSQIASLGANVTSYSDTTSLAAGTTYYYRVRAANAGGDSDYSTVASGTTQIATPGSFAASAQSTSRINLTWDDVTGESGYVIQQLDGSTYVDVATVGADVTSYAVANLDDATAYSFRVRATGASAALDSAYTGTASATTAASTVQNPTGTPLAELHDLGAASGDQFGTAVAVKGNFILAGNAWLGGGVGGAVLIDATTGTVVRRFDNPADVPDSTDGFGFAVAFVGDRIAISAPDDQTGDTPKVYIYDDAEDDTPDLVLEGTQQGNTGFGRVLTALGDDLLVQEAFVGGGSEGAVYRYELGQGSREQTYLSAHLSDQIGNAMAADVAGDRILMTTFTSSGTNVIEFNATTGGAVREFAFSGAFNLNVAYSASSIFVADYHADAVYQFDRFSSSTSPVHTYSGTSGTLYGMAIAVSGDNLLITAPGEQVVISVLGIDVSLASGAAYVYNHTTQTLVQRIEDPTPDPLLTLGSGMPDTFGMTAGVFGNGSFLIGDPTDDANGLIDVGGVYSV